MEDFKHYHSIESLDKSWQELVALAQAKLIDAYAPYSNFEVAASLLLDDGTVISGTNQENAAYPSGLCAERVAVFASQSFHPQKKIKRIAIVAKAKANVELASGSSCSACRQVMLEAEFRQHEPIEILMYTNKNQWTVAKSASALLPFAFNQNNLISQY
ncbi:MAG: cytidine deaminase [Cyclobacteriaceae bacterium]|jgi:cytidine deaminase|nr:cytidine deaminase [Cyclobacteriaceae bacterium]